MSADECEEEGLNLLPIPESVRDDLISKDPFFGAWVTNPVDGSMMGGSKLSPHEVMNSIARNSEYHVVINSVSATVPNDTQSKSVSNRAGQMLDKTRDIVNNYHKPVAIVVSDFTPDSDLLLEATVELRRSCVEEGFPVFPTIGRAARAIKRLIDYYVWKDQM